MELDDKAFPLLKDIVATTDEQGFKNVNWALLVGSIPEKQVWNAEIFSV